MVLTRAGESLTQSALVPRYGTVGVSLLEDQRLTGLVSSRVRIIEGQKDQSLIEKLGIRST